MATNNLRNRRNSNFTKDSDLDSLNDSEIDDIVRDIESDREKEKPLAPSTRLSKTQSKLREWGETCSWHGVPHMAQSLSVLPMLIWFVILCISGVLLVYLCYTTIKQYLSFGKTVNLNFGMVPSEFPSITFCNTNPYKLSAVQAIPELEALLAIYSQAN